MRWNWRNSATWNNNLNFRACFVFWSRLWVKYFLYFTQKSFTVSRGEWSAECGLEAVTKEERIPAPIGNNIPIVQYLDLLQFIDEFFWRVAKITKATVSFVLPVRPSS